MARDIGALQGGRGGGRGGVREARERAHATCRRYQTMRHVTYVPGSSPSARVFQGSRAPCARARDECVVSSVDV